MPASEAKKHVEVNGVTAESNRASSSAYTTPLLPLGSTTPPLTELCARIRERIDAFLAEEPATAQLRNVQQQTRISLGVIEEALKRYKLEELSLSYNGGKDCLVLLVLYLYCLHDHPALLSTPHSHANLNSSIPPNPAIQTVYIVSQHPFREVEDFVASSSKTCSLSVWRLAKPMKAAFTEYLEEFPKVRAIFVGTRRTDPHGEYLNHFDRTDHGWPDFMRCHPVIDWHYVDIWTFIRHLNIPYCPLYDQGYTSLGGTTDTNRNPALRRKSVSASGKPEFIFRPAYELMEDLEERLGRELRASQQPSKHVSQEKLGEDPRKADPRNECAVYDDDETASM